MFLMGGCKLVNVASILLGVGAPYYWIEAMTVSPLLFPV